MIKQILGLLTGHVGKHPFPHHLTEGRNIAADGMVLLKNKNHSLPIRPGNIALFGTGACDTVYCGTGSGFVSAPYFISVKTGLENAGFSLTSGSWLKRFAITDKKINKADKTLSFLKRFFSGEKIRIDDLEITENELLEAQKADTCIYAIRRSAGENHDRHAQKGDYFLSDLERQNLETIAKTFKNVIVVLNTCVIDPGFIDEIPGIAAVVLMGPAGGDSGNALADVLTGKVCPSGKLTDTWAKKYADYPASATFSHNDGITLQEDYSEDIFVGYRHFDSFHIKPQYPFGFGLSYTTFEFSVTGVRADWHEVAVSVSIKNTGKVPGKEVLQVYVTAPEGSLIQPYQELKGFSKTKLLQPGENQSITIRFSTEYLASFDTEKAAFVMEKGDYLIRFGNSSRDTSVAAIIRLDQNTIIRNVRNECAPDRPLPPIPTPERPKETVNAPIIHLSSENWVTIDGVHETPVPSSKSCPIENPTFDDVKAGIVTVEDFVNTLDENVLLRLVTGDANETPYSVPKRMIRKAKPLKATRSSGATTGLFAESLGIPRSYLTDGPAGLHLTGLSTTAYPCGIVMAQTWDPELCRTMGVGIGQELKYYRQSVILGPGMNIHRDPLCGRNFEYYSEDPLLSGKMACAVTDGVQSTPGSFVAVKHFCANNQEEDRTTGNARVSERALREIYLRGFEICVREAKPRTVMTSYNKLNGIHTSSHISLLNNILREEWGFEGMVMTDWGSQSDKTLDFHAGNDIIMGGYRTQKLLAALHGDKPLFAENGFVKEEVFAVYGGFFKETVQYWNTFVPSKDGTDTVSTTVHSGVKLHDAVNKMVQEGIASIEALPGGDQRVTYHGTDHGASLHLDDVKKCAVRVLTFLKEVRDV